MIEFQRILSRNTRIHKELLGTHSGEETEHNAAQTESTLSLDGNDKPTELVENQAAKGGSEDLEVFNGKMVQVKKSKM